MHEAKTHLSKLVDEEFVIARDGRPVARVTVLVRRACSGAVRAGMGRRTQTAARLVQLTITLAEIEPPIWRRRLVPADVTMVQLHELIQVAMGWSNHHLHLFEINTVLYGDLDDDGGRELGNERIFTVGEAAGATQEFTYEYDFGDSWEHRIRIEQTMPGLGDVRPQLLGGERACPPEDCGGVWGYEELLAVLADPEHGEYTNMRTWAGDFEPEAFDVTTTNDNIQLVDRLWRRTRPR